MPIWFVVTNGLLNYRDKDENLIEAFHRIETVHTTAAEYFKNYVIRSEDVFDQYRSRNGIKVY